MAASAAVASPASAAPRPSFAPQVPVARESITNLITQMRDRSGSTDLQFWRDGVFQNGELACSPCHLGPATAAATVRDADPATPAWLDDLAIASFDRALRDLDADGTFRDPTNGSAPIATMFFANELGTALLHLRHRLPSATRARWTDALRRAADRLVRGGDLTWYANGNIQLGMSEAMYLTWLATGEKLYRDRFETGWRYAITPPLAATGRTSGPAGLVVTVQPTKDDGSDGAGYLTETGASGTGYDPYYTVLQTDHLSRLYLLTRDPRVLRVLNLTTNQQLRRVNTATGMLDTRGGTRVTTAGLMPFTTAAVQVLAMTGKRPDLLASARAQFAVYGREYATMLRRADHIQYRNTSTKFATAYEALMGGIDAEAPQPAGAAVTRATKGKTTRTATAKRRAAAARKSRARARATRTATAKARAAARN